MADDEKVPPGTRYDALRLLGCEPWEKRGSQLTRYLTKGTHAELQAGAVTGVGDVDAPEATVALVAALPQLEGANANLALDALLRTDDRVTALLDAVEAGKIDSARLGDARVSKLTAHPNEALCRRATALLKP